MVNKGKKNSKRNKKPVFLGMVLAGCIVTGVFLWNFTPFSSTAKQGANLDNEPDKMNLGAERGAEFEEKNVVKRKETDKTDDSSETEVYIDIKNSNITFYKEDRKIEQEQIDSFVKINECIELPPKITQKIKEFSNDSPRVYVSGIGNKRREDLRETGKGYCLISKSQQSPFLSSQSYLLADMGTGMFLTKKGITEKFPIASITKIVTSVVLLEEMNEQKMTKVSSSAYGVPSNGAGDLYPGDEIKVGDLIYPLILESSNVAAEVIAEEWGRADFIEKMNKKAEEIGLENTHFDDPSGLSSENVSTARDLFKLSRYIYEKHPYIYNVSCIDHYDNGKYFWENINKLIADKEFEGGKTGYIPEAGRTNLAIFKTKIPGWGERKISTVLLNSSNRRADMSKMLRYLRNNLFLSSAELVDSREEFLSEEFSILLTGDIMLDRGVLNSVQKHAESDFSYLFEGVDLSNKADVNFGNLEGPVSDKGFDTGKDYSFRMKPRVLDLLKEQGFYALNLANNHAGDWGRKAFEDTLNRMNKNNIRAVGAGSSKKPAQAVKVIEQGGYKIGFLGFSDVGPEWMRAEDNSSGILTSSSPEKMKDIIQQGNREVDVLVVSMHFGQEYRKEPTEKQKKLARMAIESGADVVAGHHPHVVQSVKEYKGGVIAYSLGNLIFDQNFSKETMSGLMLKVTFKEGEMENYTKISTKLTNKFKLKIVDK